MKRLLLDCRVVSERIDGLSRYTLGIARAVARSPRDFRIRLIMSAALSPEHELHRIARLPGVDTVLSREPMMRLSAHLRMASLFRRHPCDLYHYPHFNLPLTAPRPSIITIHDVTPYVYAAFYGKLHALKRAHFWLATTLSVRRAAAVIVPSRASADALARRFAVTPGRMHVIPEGVDPALTARPREDELLDCRGRYMLRGPYLLYVGVSRPHKNLAGLLRSFARVADRLPHELLIVGQRIGPLGELRRLAAALGLGRRVRWLGYVPDADLRCLYRLADAFVLCSLFEGFGLSVIEAMASGAPVVCSADSAAGEVADGAALLVDPQSEESIAHGLLTVCERADVREDLRQRGAERAALFTWERAAERTLDVYEHVLAEAR